MITETLRRWLNKLFAWWPWKQSSRVDYSQTTNSLNRGMTQELVWRTSVDGYIPQPGITSVAVEQEMDDSTLEPHRPPIDEHSERNSQSYEPDSNEVGPSLFPQTHVVQGLSPFSDDTTSSSNEEQHLMFLHYLIKHRVYNEGFAQGQEPEQYKQKQ